MSWGLNLKVRKLWVCSTMRYFLLMIRRCGSASGAKRSNARELSWSRVWTSSKNKWGKGKLVDEKKKGKSKQKRKRKERENEVSWISFFLERRVKQCFSTGFRSSSRNALKGMVKCSSVGKIASIVCNILDRQKLVELKTWKLFFKISRWWIQIFSNE